MSSKPILQIRPGDRVTLHYRINCMGQEIVNTYKEGPDTFTYGSGELAASLERLLKGLTVETHHTWQLEPGQAFGDRDELLVQRLPRSEFEHQHEALQPDLCVDFQLPNGDTLTGTLLSMDDSSVQIDFNHPLAGLPIEFEVQVLAIERGALDDH